jgi:hypothetical protein
MIDKQLRWGMLEENASISIRRQCKILLLCRSSHYYININIDDSELANAIREIYINIVMTRPA